MTDVSQDKMLDRVDIEEMRLATLAGTDDLVLRFIFKPQAAPVEAQMPAATPALKLTRQQARHLLLLLGQGLGVPGSDIAERPAKTRH